jgi:hypothetical protein
MFDEDSVTIHQQRQVNSTLLPVQQEQFYPAIEMVLEKRRQSVTAYDGHHGLKVLLNTFCFSEHRFDLSQFIISIGFSGRMELMTLIRKEIRKKRNNKKHNKKEIEILDIDFNQIAVGLLESFGLMEPQPSPLKKAANLPVLVSHTGIDYPKN